MMARDYLYPDERADLDSVSDLEFVRTVKSSFAQGKMSSVWMHRLIKIAEQKEFSKLSRIRRFWQLGYD